MSTVLILPRAGLLGGGLSDDAVLAELAAALQLGDGGGGMRGPVVLLLVLSAGCTFTAEEAGCLRRLVQALGPPALEHALLLFTHGDQLEADDTPLYEYLRDSPLYLKVLRAGLSGVGFSKSTRHSKPSSSTTLQKGRGGLCLSPRSCVVVRTYGGCDDQLLRGVVCLLGCTFVPKALSNVLQGHRLHYGP